MLKATADDRQLVIDILTESFEDNSSVNYVVKNDSRKHARVKGLMNYSFKICRKFGDVWISDDRAACALILFPDRKTFSIASTWWDVELAASVIGFTRVVSVLKREAAIKSYHPDSPFAYLWFIGVQPSNQNQRKGTNLLREIINTYRLQNRPIYLETSVDRNLPWYLKNGFEILETIDLGYPLTFLRRNFESATK